MATGVTEEFFTDQKSLTEVAYRSEYRPRDRGLLLLYPIKPNTEIAQEEYDQMMADSKVLIPVRAKLPVIGVALVFPKTTNSSSAFRYVVNSSV